MVTPPYAADLRVYEPLAAFDVEERRRWQQYAQRPAVASTREGARQERLLGLVCAAAPRPRVPRPGEAGEHASVLRGESGLLVCPSRTELRCWEAAAESRAVLPTDVAEIALPDAEVELAVTEHKQWLARHPTRRSHLLQSRWVVPVRWFLLFDREERRLQLGVRAGEGARHRTGGAVTAVGRSLVYRTPMAQARRRVARGLSVLRKAFDDAPVVAAVESLGRWLEEFHPRSIVELDYGGLVDLRDDADLRSDDSAGDVAEAVAALAAGDTTTATEAYERVMDRWRMAHRVESAN
jgi:hypothetical protein